MIIQHDSLDLDTNYVVRYLLLGILFYWVVYSAFLSDLAIGNTLSVAFAVYFAICVILFPIAKYTVDKFVNFAMGGSILVFSVLFGLFCSFLIWAFAPFIAPFIVIGLAYSKIKAAT